MTSPAFFSAAAISSLNHHSNALLFNVSTTTIHPTPCATSFPPRPRVVDGGARGRAFAVRASDSTTFVDDPSVASSSGAVAVLSEEEEKAAAAEAKIGARVRVTVPLKVYHVPRVPEIDLTGKVGVLKQYVAVWKGKRISANLPFKVEFFTEVEGRGQVKVLAHLKEDEFEYLD